MKMNVEDNRGRGWPKKRCLDTIENDMRSKEGGEERRRRRKVSNIW